MNDIVAPSWVAHYVVVRTGNFHNGEHLNCAVIWWQANDTDLVPVHTAIIKDWTRIKTTFGWKTDTLPQLIIERLQAIHTLSDYKDVYAKMGPYTPFDFSDERASINPKDPDTLLGWLITHFLVEPI